MIKSLDKGSLSGACLLCMFLNVHKVWCWESLQFQISFDLPCHVTTLLLTLHGVRVAYPL